MIRSRLAATTLMAVGLFASPAPASADVIATDAGGFVAKLSVDSAMTPTQAYAAFQRIDAWWASSHTYSGAAANLSLSLTPGGCWCEALPNGGFVRHMSVEYANPGKALRLSGGLGPLQAMGVAGAMSVTFEAKGTGSVIQVEYRVAGRADGGWNSIAGAVDRVLGEQFARLAALPAT